MPLDFLYQAITTSISITAHNNKHNNSSIYLLPSITEQHSQPQLKKSLKLPAAYLPIII